MKKLASLFILTFVVLCSAFCPHCQNKTTKNTFQANAQESASKPQMAIVVDDFGSYDQSGVETLSKCKVPLTCAVLPNVDNTESNIKQFESLGHEIILHMPMSSHVNLPEDWYGPVYIKNTDSPKIACEKITSCLKQFPNVKGFNIHIGSGVSRNKTLMTAIYDFANKNNLYFLDSRTIETHATEDACLETESIYLGRNVFLEADKNRSYAGVVSRLLEGAKIAQEEGFSIVIGHVGAEGGENTATAILNTISKIEDMGVEVVPLSKIHDTLKNHKQRFVNN